LDQRRCMAFMKRRTRPSIHGLPFGKHRDELSGNDVGFRTLSSADSPTEVPEVHHAA
jgi:hypothetical protein